MTRWLAMMGAGLMLSPAWSPAAIRPQLLVEGLQSPVFATAPPGEESRLFVLEQGGTVRVVDLGRKQVLPTPFLTISGLTTGGEQGLLGLAFDPGYARNRTFYVNVTAADGSTQIRRYRTSASNPNVADARSGQVILSFAQPYANHNGGWIGFGPDGFLYIASGDGGSGNDPDNNAQNLNRLLGKILRIDVSPAEAGRSYRIPADNPFASGGGAPEIWHYGLRNPWRCSFDRETGDLWIGDVGQSAREEVNVQRAAQGGGLNFGWRVFEGDIRTAGISDPAPPGLVAAPAFTYSHAEGYSVTGGYVMQHRYDGDARGVYVFGDFSGRIWTKRLVGGALVDPEAANRYEGPSSLGAISSFGEDGAGRLYLVAYSGEIYRLRGASRVAPSLRVEGSQRREAIGGKVLLRGQVSGSEPVRAVRYRVDNGDWRVARGRSVWRLQADIPRGTHRVRIQAEDSEGARSGVAAILVTRR